MEISHRALPKVRLAVLAVFGLICALMFSYLWTGSGGHLPLVSHKGYRVTVNLPHASNLVYDSDVMIAGIKVGKVSALDAQGDLAHATLRLDRDAPLHEGVTVQVRNKTLVQETFLEVTDGKGRALVDGSSLPDKAALPYTDLNDVLTTLDPATRKSLGHVVTSLGAVSADARDGISAALSGLGMLGQQGKDALDALAAQSGDLRVLTSKAAALVSALNNREGEIATLVTNADTLTRATASQSQNLALAVQGLPRLIGNAQTAGSSLEQLAGSLAPVSANLNAAAPDLTAAIRELPQTATDLRGLLPSLNTVLDSAPATLKMVPNSVQVVDHLIPTLKTDLADLNPILGYLQPYGPDIAAFFSNFGDALSRGDSLGHILQVFPILNEQSVRGNPVNTQIGPLNKSNPYPEPGQNRWPGPFTGTYPHLGRESIK